MVGEGGAEMVVEECEERLATMTGRRGAVLTSRATVGLAAVLRGLGLPKGSGVLMPVMVCANVAHAVRGAGLEPVFVDMEVGEFGFGMDIGKAERVVGEREGVRVLLAVPLFGGGVDAKRFEGLAKRHGLVVVEDAAQYGVRNSECGTRVRRAVATVHSFGAGKIGDAGGGGAVVGDDLGLLESVRREVAGKRDLAEIAGRVIRSLDGLDVEIEGRHTMAEMYRGALQLERVEHPRGELPLWKYSVLVRDREERDRVTRRLLERGVEASNLYAPLSRWFGGYKDWGRQEFSAAWGAWERIVNLPLWPVKEGMVEDVRWGFVR